MKDKTIVSIVARLSSTRLPGKHLREVSGRPILSFLTGRINSEFIKEITEGTVEIVITSADELSSREFDRYLDELNCSVFYGNVSNIPQRQLDCMNKFRADRLISVDGDDILCSVEAMRSVYSQLLAGKDYISTQGLPLGMNVSGYTRAFLQDALSKSVNSRLEVGWGRIFNEHEPEKLVFDHISDDKKLRYTLDYPEDLEFFETLIEGLGDKIFSTADKDIVEYTYQHSLQNITEPVIDEYWKNFNKEVADEKKQI